MLWLVLLCAAAWYLHACYSRNPYSSGTPVIGTIAALVIVGGLILAGVL